MGVHRRRPGPRLPPGRRDHGPGVHAVPPHRHGVAAERARHLDHGGRPRRRRHAPEQGRQAHHVRLHPSALRERDGGHGGRGRPLARGVDERHHLEGAPHAGSPPARHRRARDPHRGEGGPRLTARRRVPRHPLAPLRGGHQEEAPRDVPPVQGARRRRHHEGADGGRADGALHDGRHQGRSGHARDLREGALRGRRVRRRDARLQSPRRQLALRPPRVRPHRRPATPASSRRRRARRASTRRRSKSTRGRRSSRSTATRASTPSRSTRTS